MRTAALSLSIAVALGTVVACSSSSNSGSGSGFSDGTGGSSGGAGGSGGTGSGSGGTDGSGSSSGSHFGSSGGGTDAGSGGGCNPSPANYDIPNNGCDDDGDGKVDNVTVCDQGLLQAGDGAEMAKAMGFCQTTTATDTKWGLISAVLTNGYDQKGAGADNFKQQHGILTGFGSAVTPREGSSLGVLSSGTADLEDTGDNGPYFKGQKKGMQTGPGSLPPGFPQAAQGCPSRSDVYDVIDLKLQVKVPANAKGFSFDFDFYSGEWPEYVCTDYNDSFVAYLRGNNGTGTGSNISFDTKNNPISVNVGFFKQCTTGVITSCMNPAYVLGGGPVSQCAPNTESILQGTGFFDQGQWCNDGLNPQTSSGGGATGWLTSQAPAQPGDVIWLDLVISDTHDANYDSSVLLDNFTWVPSPVSGPVTQPSPPK